MSKYHAVRTEGPNGKIYHSKAEANRAWSLQLLQKLGEISNLREQVPFELLPAGMGYNRPLLYIADFVYNKPGQVFNVITKENSISPCAERVVEDVKGMRTPVYKLKKRLMAQLLGITILETGSTESNPVKLPRVRVKAPF